MFGSGPAFGPATATSWFVVLVDQPQHGDTRVATCDVDHAAHVVEHAGDGCADRDLLEDVVLGVEQRVGHDALGHVVRRDDDAI